MTNQQILTDTIEIERGQVGIVLTVRCGDKARTWAFGDKTDFETIKAKYDEFVEKLL